LDIGISNSHSAFDYGSIILFFGWRLGNVDLIIDDEQGVVTSEHLIDKKVKKLHHH
jgi:hypothetical protein